MPIERVGLLTWLLAACGAAAQPVPTASAERGAQMSDRPTPTEPNLEQALTWWSDLPDKWTPVGWRNHMFRFNLLYNSTVIAEAHRNQRTAQWAGAGVQLTFLPLLHDDNRVTQGWTDEVAPVLWSEWAYEGIVRRSYAFAHIPGGGDVESGAEPLFLWMRLTLHDLTDGLPIESRTGFDVKINAPYHRLRGMQIRNTSVTDVEKSAYPRELTAEREPPDPRRGCRILEPDGRVRLAVAPGEGFQVAFTPKKPTDRDCMLEVRMDTDKGAHVDLLLPMLPAEREVFDRELALGYDAALAEANRYWGVKPETAATYEVPEEHLNRMLKRVLQFAEIIAEKDPATGEYALLSGGWVYANMWATPTAMNSAMVLDTMGYHSVTERYLRIYKKQQGTTKPPGASFAEHPGYLSCPRQHSAIDWLSDHGALLYAVSQHALLCGDTSFIDEWTPAIINACEFIRDARRIEGHGGFPGILPPGVATDRKTEIQAIWNDGWHYKGLVTAVRLLKKTGHPRAAEFAAEAREYKEAFLTTFRTKAATMPVWTDASGMQHHLTPTSLFNDQPSETRHAFYLDTGPLFLVFSELMDADDELMRSTLLWFRDGPPRKTYRYDSNCWQVPSLQHEISSCEPGLSWNVFHSWQSGDRRHFLEGMYSLATGMVSQQTFTVCETRGGITGVNPPQVLVYMMRLAVVDDRIRDGELHLLRFMPLAWLRTDEEAVFQNIPTEFGPVSLTAMLSRDGKTLRATFSGEFRERPERIVLHVPPVPGLKGITLNGKPLAWDGKSDTVVVSGR
jgi:hypothetical protein